VSGARAVALPSAEARAAEPAAAPAMSGGAGADARKGARGDAARGGLPGEAAGLPEPALAAAERSDAAAGPLNAPHAAAAGAAPPAPEAPMAAAKAALRRLQLGVPAGAPLNAPPQPAPRAALRPPCLGGRTGPAGAQAAGARLDHLRRLREAAQALVEDGAGPGSQSQPTAAAASAIAPLLDAGEEATSGLRSRVPTHMATQPSPASGALAEQGRAGGSSVGVGREGGGKAEVLASVRGVLFQPGRPDAARRAIAERLNRLSVLQQAGEELLAAW